MSEQKQRVFTCDHCGLQVTIDDPHYGIDNEQPDGWCLAKPPHQNGGEFKPYDLCSLKCLINWAGALLKEIQRKTENEGGE